MNAYNEAMAFHVDGRLEPARLFRALTRLAQAHEVLRARLIEVDGEPRLVFDRPASAIEFKYLGRRRPALEWEPTEATHRPFDLNEGPLWRAVLRNERAGGSALLLVVHHLILDAASESILLGDLIASYSESRCAAHSARARLRGSRGAGARLLGRRRRSARALLGRQSGRCRVDARSASAMRAVPARSGGGRLHFAARNRASSCTSRSRSRRELGLHAIPSLPDCLSWRCCEITPPG